MTPSSLVKMYVEIKHFIEERRRYYSDKVNTLFYLMNFHIVKPSSLLGPDIRLDILFLNTLSLHSSLNVWDHVSITTVSIIVLYISILKFLEGSREDKNV